MALIFNIICGIFITNLAMSSASESVSSAGTAQLIQLGTVDGKSFFADTLADRTWFGARNFCEESGMSLAKIESEAQWNLLSDAYNVTTFVGDYWTAARDSNSPSQFYWDNSNQTVGDFVSWQLRTNYIQTCVYFRSNSDPAERYLQQFKCDGYATGVLCEMRSEI